MVVVESQATTDLLSITGDQFLLSRTVCKWNTVCTLFAWLLCLNIITLIFIPVIYKNSFLCPCRYSFIDCQSTWTVSSLLICSLACHHTRFISCFFTYPLLYHIKFHSFPKSSCHHLMGNDDTRGISWQIAKCYINKILSEQYSQGGQMR